MHTSYWLIMVAGFVGQPGNLPPFVTENVKTITFYYMAPDPTLGPKLLKDLLRKENIEHPFFLQDGHVLRLIGAQLGDIAAGKPEIVREYEGAFAGAPLAGRRVIVRALWNCGDDKTVKRAEAWLDDTNYADIGEELNELKALLEDPKRKHVRDQPARTPEDLDFLWANFFITGEYAAVSRILDVFDAPDAKENETMKRVARWSLSSNVQQHPKLVEVIQKHIKERAEGSRKVIDGTILTFPKTDKP